MYHFFSPPFSRCPQNTFFLNSYYGIGIEECLEEKQCFPERPSPQFSQTGLCDIMPNIITLTYIVSLVGNISQFNCFKQKSTIYQTTFTVYITICLTGFTDKPHRFY